MVNFTPDDLAKSVAVGCLIGFIIMILIIAVGMGG